MNRILRHFFVATAIAQSFTVSGLVCASTDTRPKQSLASAGPAKPNIVIILADDMGYSDVGCFGGEIQTPNLDQLAANGLRYTHFYNTSRCWPTRSSLLTGYYAQAVGKNRSRPGGAGPAWVTTIPQYLRKAGYRSYHCGKWHVRTKPRVVADGGFDKSYYLNENDNYFWDYRHLLNDVDLEPLGQDNPKYATITVTDYAVEFLQDHQQQWNCIPFFLYIAYTIPHFPLKALPEDIEKYRNRYTEGWDVLEQQRWRKMKAAGLIDHAAPPREVQVSLAREKRQLLDTIGDGEVLYPVAWDSLNEKQKDFQATKMAIHAAMVDRIDQETGRVIDQLKRMGVFDNTIIFFLSDNGASAEMLIRGKGHDPAAEPGTEMSYLCLGPGWAHASNTPFRRYKTWVHEGGVATPLIVHWPAGIQSRGAIRHDPGHVVDFMPTLLDLARIQPPTGYPDSAAPPLHGVSLVPSFFADRVVNREFIFFSHNGNRALRMGDWKIVSAKMDHDEWFLYNLADDRGEQIDRKAEHPGLCRTLVNKWIKLDRYYRDINGR